MKSCVAMVTHKIIIELNVLLTVMEAVSLQERLQLIQQQQRERFKTRKSLKIKGDNLCPDNQGRFMSANHAGPPCGLDEANPGTDLELRTASYEDRAEVKTSNCKLDLSVPTSKEIEYLKSCVERVQSDNARLKSEQKQKERKIVELEKEREEERVAMGTAGATATQRIVELSKRNRELSAEVAAEKNHVRHLQKKLKESEMNNTSQTGNPNDSSQPSGYMDLPKRIKGDALPKPQEDQTTVIAQLQEQLQQSKLKMAEQRNQCQVLKQELKLAQRVITKEVGEGVNMSTLLSGATPGWRGRAQKIIALQSKLAELGKQLREFQGRQNGSTHVRRGTSDRAVAAPMVDARQKAALRKIENDKQKNLDEARSELESLKASYSKIIQQCNALKARNKTLTSTVKSLKEEISLTAKEDQRGEPRRPRSTSSKSDNFDMLQDTEREKQLLNKENQILRTQLEKCLTELQTSKKSMKDITSSTLQPIALRGQQSSGHQIDRKAVSAGQPLGLLYTHSSGNDSLMAQVSQIERERLLELTRCLQQRLDAMMDKFNGLDIEMRALRQQNTRLERIVSRNHATNNILSNVNKETSDRGKVDELETQLMIQMDVNAVLKETLDVTRQEKLEDMKRYQAMLQEVKTLFMNSV